MRRGVGIPEHESLVFFVDCLQAADQCSFGCLGKVAAASRFQIFNELREGVGVPTGPGSDLFRRIAIVFVCKDSKARKCPRELCEC